MWYIAVLAFLSLCLLIFVDYVENSVTKTAVNAVIGIVLLVGAYINESSREDTISKLRDASDEFEKSSSTPVERNRNAESNLRNRKATKETQAKDEAHNVTRQPSYAEMSLKLLNLVRNYKQNKLNQRRKESTSY